MDNKVEMKSTKEDEDCMNKTEMEIEVYKEKIQKKRSESGQRQGGRKWYRT